MIQSASIAYIEATPQKDSFSRCNSLHAIKFKPSDFHNQKSPCKKDRFFSAERNSFRPRLFSLPAWNETSNPLESNFKIMNQSPFKDIKSPKPPLPSMQRKQPIPIVTDKVLEAPDVVDDPPVKLIDFSRKNAMAVALGNSVYIWDDGNSALLLEADCPITSLCWVENQLIVSARGEVELWDPMKGQMVRSFPSHLEKCGSCSFIGHRLASGGSDGIINITDIRSDDCEPYEAHKGSVCSLSWSSDGVHLASSGLDSKVIIWGDQKKCSYDFKAPVYGLNWISQNIFACGDSTENGNLILSSINKNEDEQLCHPTGAPISGISYHEKWGLTLSHRTSLSDWEMWAPNELRKVAEYGGHKGDIINLCGSKDGRYIATIGSDETLRLWEMKEKTNTPSKYSKQSTPIGPLR